MDKAEARLEYIENVSLPVSTTAVSKSLTRGNDRRRRTQFWLFRGLHCKTWSSFLSSKLHMKRSKNKNTRWTMYVLRPLGGGGGGRESNHRVESTRTASFINELWLPPGLRRFCTDRSLPTTQVNKRFIHEVVRRLGWRWRRWGGGELNWLPISGAADRS